MPPSATVAEECPKNVSTKYALVIIIFCVITLLVYHVYKFCCRMLVLLESVGKEVDILRFIASGEKEDKKKSKTLTGDSEEKKNRNANKQIHK